MEGFGVFIIRIMLGELTPEQACEVGYYFVFALFITEMG